MSGSVARHVAHALNVPWKDKVRRPRPGGGHAVLDLYVFAARTLPLR